MTTEYFARCNAHEDGLQYKCKACESAYYFANKELISQRRLAYREGVKQRASERSRAWYVKNKERVAETNRIRRATKKEQVRSYYQRHRALKRKAEGTHTGDDIKRQYKAQKGKCYYCDVKVGETYDVDHVVPLSRGGSDGPENIVIACAVCNRSKSNKMPHEWPQGGRLL